MVLGQADSSLAIARNLWGQNRVAEAEAILRDVVAQQPGREDAAMLLAEVLRAQGRLSAASVAVLQLCRANGFTPDLCLRGARFVRECDRHTIATRICAEALTRTTASSADLLALAGHVARESGDFDVARAHYLGALDAGVDLERNHILGALANTRRYTDVGDPDIARCNRHFHDSAFSMRSRASAGFGLAKIRDDLGDYAAAALILREANAMVRTACSWDSKSWRAFVDARVHECVAPASRARDGDFVPVLIVGVPRSGTTLTAGLLARATGARDRGELRTLRYIAQQLIDGDHLGSAAALVEAADLYRRLAVQDDAPTTWYLDQDPLNFRWLHIAAAMFPQARVIHLRRDLRDTALSLWGQDFAHPDLAFAYDFEAMRAFMRGHDELMSRWRRTLPIEVLDLDYEALVGDSDTEIEKLAAFIGAPLVHASAGTDAPVTSTSVWQARQPVYSTSVGRWKNYVPYIPELGQFAPAE